MKMFKRIAALAMSAVMAAGLLVTPAMAAGGNNPSQIGYGKRTGSITVMNVEEGANPYSAYRLFDLRLSEDEDGNVTYQYCISDEENPGSMDTGINIQSPWLSFFETGAGKEYVDLTRTVLDGRRIAIVTAKGDFASDNEETASQAAAELAQKALAFVKANPDIDWKEESSDVGNMKRMIGGMSAGVELHWKYSLEVKPQDESAVDLRGYTPSDTGYIAQVTNVIPGYYLVDSSMGSLCAMDSTDLNAVIYEKNEKPTIKKEVKDNESNWVSANDVGIGDTVEFRVEVNPQGLLGGQGQTSVWPEGAKFTVIYNDGVINKTVFPDQSYGEQDDGDWTPAFVGTPARDGYTFVGWNPTPTPTVDPSMANEDGEIIYIAQWAKTITVAYTDGVNGETVFPDQSYEGLKDGDSTPAFKLEDIHANKVTPPTLRTDFCREGYDFMGWSPEVKATVDRAMADDEFDEITYTAIWEVNNGDHDLIPIRADYPSTGDTGNTASTGTRAQITGLEQSGGSNTGSGSGVSSNSTLSIRDTLDAGLTFDRWAMAELFTMDEYGNETWLGNDYLNWDEETNSFTYTFTQTVDPPNKIVLYYTATVNSDAVIGGAGNTNTVELLIGDKPSSESKTTTYVHKMDLVKVNRDNEILSGAEFELYNDFGVQLAVEYWDYTDDGRTVYRVTGTVSNIRDTDMDDGMLSLLRSDEKENIIVAGNVVIEGLGAGTYYLRETKAPEGYNRAGDQYFTVVPNKVNGSSDGTMTLTIGVQTNVSADAEVNGDQYISGGMAILNLSGAELPSTGGIGTTIFYVVGGLLVVGAGILLVVKKRMSDQ